jgi:cysteinyl-tRNA synthetase
MKFLERMDDDFNTADAIASLHELAALINKFLEQNKAEAERDADDIQAAAAAFLTLRKLGKVLGLFRQADLPRPAKTDDLDRVMKFLIELRREARAAKNFALADRIRNGLKDLGFALEDRSDATGWRKD